MRLDRFAAIAAIAAVALAVAAAAACGGKTVFGLTSDDNNQDELGRALAQRKLPAAPAVRNRTGTPMVFAVVSGKQKRLTAYDLRAGKSLWTVEANVQSRVAVAGDVVVSREGDDVVARAIATGQVSWKKPIGGEFGGLAADGDDVAFVAHAGQKSTLVGLSSRGEERWRQPAPGRLGAPAVQGGLVYSPFLSQWLSILDAASGAQLTRIRGIDEQISFVRTTSDATFFGSKAGVFRLDDKAASGTRVASTFGKVELPKQLKASYGSDAFDPVQAGYSASDRTRILWRADATGDGFKLLGDGVAVHWFRFVFGTTPAGELRWAYSHPRVDLVASEHAGTVIAAVSAGGEVVALDPVTGAIRGHRNLGVAGGQVLGATFDADGWVPAGEAGEPPATVAALVSIARDRDARFQSIKELSVAWLAKLAGPEVTRDLIAIAQDPRTPPRLRDAVTEVMVSRRDPTGVAPLLEGLQVQSDFVEERAPSQIGILARVVAAIDATALDGVARQALVAALSTQLTSPSLDSAEVSAVAEALVALGGPAERARVGSFLLIHRADPEFGTDQVAGKGFVEALLRHGGASERELIRYVAEDGRTAPGLAAYAAEALAKRK